MRALKSLLSFLKNQLKQIRAGGLYVLCRKIKKAAKLLAMIAAAPIAVYFKFEWPQAYDFMAENALKRLKQIRLQSIPDALLIDKWTKKLIGYLKKNNQRIPDLSSLHHWMRRSTLLGNLYILKNEIKESMNVYQTMADVQRNITQRHQLDKLDVEFIPRAVPLGSIGVYEYLEIYIKAGMLDGRPNKRMILLLDLDASVNNPCYLGYWNKHFTIISDPALIEMLTPLEHCLTAPFISFMHFRGKLCKSSVIQGTVREQWIKEDRPPFFALSNEDYQRGWDCLQSLGLPRNAWFVTLHVREAGWRDRGSREEDFRNADIATYLPAIKAVTDAGGWVLRIGDPGMSKLPRMPQVIDYAHSKAKTDWMDIFLCAQCRFMIGTSSGMCVIASAFGVPLVMTNLLPAYGVYHFTSKDLFIPRLCFSKDRENYLNFYELMSPPISTATAQSQFDHKNIRIVANKSEEIKALVEEMLAKCAGTLEYSEEDEILQKRFRETTADCGRLYGELNLVSAARIGKQFLRDHAELLSANVAEESLKKEKITSGSI